MSKAVLPDTDLPIEMSRLQLRRYAIDMRYLVEVERRRIRELAAANERLGRLDALKSDFLRLISHELRTPLNHVAVVGLFDPKAPAQEQAETLAMIREGYERLELLVQRGLDYLYWASREPGSAGSRASWQDALQAAIRQTGVAVEMPPAANARPVVAERDELVLIFQELLNNARKHGPANGAVRVTAAESDDMTAITVHDSGGLPREMCEEIFRPFTIVESDRHTHGSGLGLAIARAAAGAFGGTLRAESDGAGQGARFILELKHVQY